MSYDHTVKVLKGQPSEGVFTLWKKRGETLAALLGRTRVELDIAPSVPLTYAGRLDPMAEGLVIILSGECCKEKDQYIGLSKIYEFEILFGVSTDTADVLGIVQKYEPKLLQIKEVQEVVKTMNGKVTLLYPMYSSKPVQGVPLFVYAREGRVPPEIPTQEGEVLSIEFISLKEVSIDSVIDEIQIAINTVQGDFRQVMCSASWSELNTKYPHGAISIASCRARVTSGTYIRSLCEAIGKKLGVPAIAYRIVRTAFV